MNQKFPNRASLLFSFLKGSKRFFFISILFSSLVSVFDLLCPRIVAFTVDTVLTDAVPQLPGFIAAFTTYFDISAELIPYLREHLYLVSILIILVAVLRGLSRYGFQLFNAKGAEGLVYRARQLLYAHIVRLPMSWHNANQTGDIIQRCTSDVDTIRNFLSEQLVNLVRVVILIVFAVAFMLQINVRLTFLAIALVPLIILYSVYFHYKIAASFEKVDAMEGRLSAMVQENLTGVRVVRAFGKERYEKERFEQYNEAYMNTWVRLMRLLSSFWAMGDLSGGLQALIIIAFGAIYCVRGTLTAGEFIEFTSYNAMLAWPVRTLGRVISDMSKAGISIDRLRYILNSPAEADRPDATEPPLDRDIVFEDVSFSYEADAGSFSTDVNSDRSFAMVLSHISFTVKAGQTIGILGGTGSGKSTLMHLLDRIYELPEENGRITIGGVDIRNIRRQYLRRNIGMVLQEPYLFSGTLAENIAITARELRMNEVRTVSRIAALDETVERFSKGYDTYVGERGVTLSGGQKQRTAIAQMLIRKPPIMVFDDSLSAVDLKTDAQIREALSDETAHTTTILIAHRISTLMRADCIIVLDKGRVAEIGTHKELLLKNGIYRRICELQNYGT